MMSLDEIRRLMAVGNTAEADEEMSLAVAPRNGSLFCNLRSMQTVRQFAFLAIIMVCLMSPWVVIADVLTFPCPPEIPLHRIGIEIVIESVTTAVGGGVLLRWLVKNGWKKRTLLTKDERDDFERRIDAVLPILHRSVSKELTKRGISHCHVCRRCGADVSLDDNFWSGKKFCSQCGLKIEPRQCRFGFASNIDAAVFKGILEEFLKANDGVMQKLEGLPIESVADKLFHCRCEGSLWMSGEEERKWKTWEIDCDKIRKGRKPWDAREVFMESEIVKLKLLLETKKRRRRRLIMLIALLPLLIWLAWWLGQKV